MQYAVQDTVADRIFRRGERLVRGWEAAVGLALCGAAAALEWLALSAYRGE